jgi:signal transduction histidine kinase
MLRVVQPLRTWLVASHLLVLMLPVLAVLSTGALNQDLVRQTQGDLYNQGALLGLMVSEEVKTRRMHHDPGAGVGDVVEPLTDVLRQARQTTLAGIRVLDTAGVVVASSGAEIGADFSDREEVIGALGGIRSVMIRPRDSQSERQPLSSPSRRARIRLYVAVPIFLDGEMLGVVLLMRTPREHLQALYQMAPSLVSGGVMALLVTLAVALWAGWIGTRSLKALSGAAKQIAEGDWSAAGLVRAREGSHVSEVATLSRDLGIMTERLRERLSYIREFAGNVAHEFRTPISTLRGTVELLQLDAEMPAEQRALFLDNAVEDLERMDRLLTGLMTLARAEEGAERSRLELGELAEELADRYPEVQFHGEAGVVLGNRGQLESALSNLVENALRYGGEDVRIQVQSWRSERRTGFVVEDDGPGISAANLPHIFERFFTTDRQAGGTGLGLSIVKAICQAHGGTIDVESRPGRTRFRITLPRYGEISPRGAGAGPAAAR